MEDPQFVNFCRLADILLEKSSKVLSKRLEVWCTRKHWTFEQFLTKIRHDVFHMWQLSRCCQCNTTPLSSSRKLFKQQFDKLYCCIGPPIPGHVKKYSQECACHTVPKPGISPADLDISLSSFILLNFCDLSDGDRNTVIKLRDLRNKHIAHSAIARISDEDFKAVFADAEIEILAVAKCIDEEFFDEIRSELVAISSKEINDRIGAEQIKIVRQHYVSSKCLIEKVYDVFEMIRRKSRDIPEKLEQIIEIVEPIHKEVADDMRQISRVLRQPLFHDKATIKHQISFWLRELQNFMDLNNDFNDGKDKNQDVFRNCGARENNILCTKNEIEIHKNSTYLPIRAVCEAEKKLNTGGIIIFVGKTGSGKSTHSLELLHQAYNGNIFKEPHDILHLSQVDDWEHLILPSTNTLIYIEDPIGRTSANVSLIQNDGGIFQKIWSCVQKGNIKIIMSIRSNIFNEYSEDLQRYKLFHPEHIIDLSLGEFKMNKAERGELVSLYCDRYQVQIVNAKSEENIYSKESLKYHRVKIARSTTISIVKKDPAIGFPLCLKNFLGNKTNTFLGLNYFNIPTETQLSEIEELAKSKYPDDRCQFAILVLVLFSGGRLNQNSISINSLKEMGKDLTLTFLHQTMVETALKKLRNKSLLYLIADERCYKYSHDTILEAVFNVYTTLVPNKIDLLIKEADNRIIYEMVRTSNHQKNPQDSLLVLDPEFETLLIKRFISELRKNNIRNVILHPSMNDERFRNTFFHELKKEENRNIIENENVNENSLFMLSCLFNKFPMVQFLLEHSNIPQASISEGFKLSLTLDNCETLNLLLPYSSQQEIEEKFISCCLTGEVDLVKSFIQNQNKISNKVFKNGFRILCMKGRTKLVQFVLCQSQMSNELIKYGFSAACQHEDVSTAEVLFNAAIDLSDEDIKQWLICLSTTLVGQPLLEKLFFTHPTISENLVSNIFRNFCLKGNTSGLQWLLKQKCLSDESIIEVLTTIVKIKDTKNDSDIPTPRLEVNSEGIKCRSKSMESCKSKPNLSKDKICRQRSISDSTYVTEPSYDLNQAHVNLDDNLISPTFCKGVPIEDVTGLILSKRKSIKTKDLQDFILKIFENGHKDCFISVLNERPCVPENYIIDGVKLAFIGHHVDIIKVVLQRGTLSPSAINTVLTYACDKENTAIVGYILKRLDISQSTVIEKLEKAVREKNVKIVKVILQMEMYLSERVLTHLLTYLCKTGDHVILKVFLSYRRNAIPSRIIRQCFLRACHDGFVFIINQLLTQIDNLEKQTICQGLHAACKFNKVDVVESLLSRGIIFPKNILKESLIVACLNYSLEAIETIGRCTSLSERLVNQVGIICLHVRPSLFTSVIKIYKKDVPSLTGVGSYHQSLYDSTLTTILRDIGDSFSTSKQTDSSGKSLHILSVYGDKTTISTVYQNAFYMSHWMVSEILKNACKENRHKIVQTILDLANDIPFDILHQGLVQAVEHHSVESIRCILNSRQDIPEWCLEGFFVPACRNSSAKMVTTVLACRRELRTEFLEKGVTFAVVNKNHDIAKILLRERIDIPKRCFVDLFKAACVNCDSSIVALLLQFERCIDISIVISCFRESCILNLKPNVEMILQQSIVPCDVVLQGFKTACRWNNIDICCKILDAYPNLDTRKIKDQLHILCLIGKAKAILQILNYRQDLTDFVFLKCCDLGRLKIVKSILRRNTINQENLSIGIIVAIKNNHQKIFTYIFVECFLCNCLDISIPIFDECFSSSRESRHIKFIKTLLNHASGKMVVKDALLNTCRKIDLNAILENIFLSDSVQTQILQEALNIASSILIFIILIKWQQLTPKNIHEGIAWLDANNKKSKTNITVQVCDEINTTYLVSVLKYACSQSSIRVIEIIFLSHCVFTQENLREILMEACSKKNPAAFEAILKLQPQLAVKHLFQILLRTIEYRDVLMLNTLLKCRRDLFLKNESLIWEKAVISGDNEILKALMKSKDHVSLKSISFALDTAFNNKNLDMYRTVLQTSPDVVDKSLMRLIFISFKEKNLNFVNEALSTRRKFSKRQCALMLVKASNQENKDIIKNILQNNPDITRDDILNLNSINRTTKRKAIRMLESTQDSESVEERNRFTLVIIMFIYWFLTCFNGCNTTGNRRKKERRRKGRQKKKKGKDKKT